MTDKSFSEDEVVPPPVSKFPVSNCHKDSCLDSESNYLASFYLMHKDDNLINTTGQLDDVNEEVKPLQLCTEINNNVKLDEEMEARALDEFN